MSTITTQNSPDYNESSLNQGRSGTLLSNNFTMLALAQDNMSEVITEMYPSEGAISTILQRMGEISDELTDKQHCWLRYHKSNTFFKIGGTVDAPDVTDNLDGTFTVGWNNDYPLYKKDVLYLPSGKAAFVIKVAKQDFLIEGYGGTLTTDDFAPATATGSTDSLKLSVLFNAQEECFTPQGGYDWTPDEMCATFTKTSIKEDVCDEALSARQLRVNIGGKYYWFHKQQMMYKQHKQHVDNIILEGRETGKMQTGASGGAGVIPLVKAKGTHVTTDIVDEQFYQDMAAILNKNSEHNHFLVFQGYNFAAATQLALKDYTINGAVHYGKFMIQDENGSNENGICAGLNIKCYNFNGKIFTFITENKFSDESVYPINEGWPSMEDSALFIGVGKEKDSLKESIKLGYRTYVDPRSQKKVLNKSQIHYRLGGVPLEGGNNEVSSLDACYQEKITSEVLVEMRTPEYHAFAQITGA